MQAKGLLTGGLAPSALVDARALAEASARW
jgi:hypothetical protein